LYSFSGQTLCKYYTSEKKKKGISNSVSQVFNR